MKGNLQCSFGVFGLGLLCLLQICFQIKSCYMKNQGDTHALSSWNTMMRSVTRILRTQSKPREMHQKAFKAQVDRVPHCLTSWIWLIFIGISKLKRGSAKQHVLWCCLGVFSTQHTQSCPACRISPLDQRPFHVAQEPPWTVASLPSDGDAVVWLQAN